MEIKRIWFYRLCLVASLLACVVVVLGAYTRLVDGGLGCPDWPGCYGQVTVPRTTAALARAMEAFPGAVVEAPKAWAEMIHRYFAGSLGLVIFMILGLALLARKQRNQPILLPVILVGLVFFQAILGMWTVTFKLLPLVVMGHLLAGLTLLCTLWWLSLQHFGRAYAGRLPPANRIKPWAVFAFIFVFIQVALGGWTSANYASMACPDFPYCQGSLLPNMDFQQAFNIMHPVGINYEGGVLNNAARMTINTVHRFAALFVFLYVGGLAVYILCYQAFKPYRQLARWLLAILAVQVLLGVLNVVLLLPLTVAVAHNAFGGLLLLALITFNFHVFKASQLYGYR